METTNIDIGYKPHAYQARVHAAATRFTVCVTHRRWGKTYMSCAQLVDAALRTTKQDARFAYLARFLKQAKQSAWDYLRRFTGPIPGGSIHESELTIKFPNGARITLYVGDNAESDFSPHLTTSRSWVDAITERAPPEADAYLRAWPAKSLCCQSDQTRGQDTTASVHLPQIHFRCS